MRIAVTGPLVTVEVADNGPAASGSAGPDVEGGPADGGPAEAPVDQQAPTEPRHRGLANLASRAGARGGHCTLDSDERATVLTWTARLDQ